MFGTIAAAAAAGAMAEAQAYQRFLRSLEGLPPEERQRRIERREDIARQERQHRETLEAQQNQGYGPGALLGAFVLGSLMD